MANDMLREWLRLAKADYTTATHLYKTMVPRPLEIICYLCQQAVEKLLKGLLLVQGEEIKKTHNLGLLAEILQSYHSIPPECLDGCYALTPYGVKVRYPQEQATEDWQAKRALAMMQAIFVWGEPLLTSEIEKAGD